MVFRSICKKCKEGFIVFWRMYHTDCLYDKIGEREQCPHNEFFEQELKSFIGSFICDKCKKELLRET